MNSKGAGLIEYGVIAGLVSIFAITAASGFGGTVGNVLVDASSTLDTPVASASASLADGPSLSSNGSTLGDGASAPFDPCGGLVTPYCVGGSFVQPATFTLPGGISWPDPSDLAVVRSNGTLNSFAQTDGTLGPIAGPNVTQAAFGTVGVEHAFIRPGSRGIIAVADYRNLLGGQDVIYFPYPWDFYTKSISSFPGAIEFVRVSPPPLASAGNAGEIVLVLNGATTSGRDMLVFSDGRSILTQNARSLLQADLNAPLP